MLIIIHYVSPYLYEILNAFYCYIMNNYFMHIAEDYDFLLYYNKLID